MSWLTYYFSMGPGLLRKFIDNGMHFDALVSFAMFNRTVEKEPETIHSLCKHLKDKRHKVMLDSGAFTNFQKPGTVVMEQYIEYLQSYKKYWDEYVTLDDLGSRERTLKNHKILLSKGLRPLFVDHIRFKDHPLVNKIWELDKKVAMSSFGTMVDRSEGARRLEVQENVAAQVAKRTELARRVKTKVHLLAVGSLTRFLKYVDIIDSVDSASWARRPSYGSMLVASSVRLGGADIPIIDWADSPQSFVTRKPPSKEMKEKLRSFMVSRKWTFKSGLIQAFCLDQLYKYVVALNKLTPTDIIQAVEREKASMQESKKSYFFLTGNDGPGSNDGWTDDSVCMRESRSNDPSYLEIEDVNERNLEYVPDLELPKLLGGVLKLAKGARSKTLNTTYSLIKQEVLKRGIQVNLGTDTPIDKLGLPKITPTNLKGISDQELLSLHLRIHKLWAALGEK